MVAEPREAASVHGRFSRMAERFLGFHHGAANPVRMFIRGSAVAVLH
jgi:hypothetical protein